MRNLHRATMSSRAPIHYLLVPGMDQILGVPQDETRGSSSERKPAFIKHFLIVDSDTFSQAWEIHLMAWSKSTDLDTLVLLTTCVSISQGFMYFSLNV